MRSRHDVPAGFMALCALTLAVSMALGSLIPAAPALPEFDGDGPWFCAKEKGAVVCRPVKTLDLSIDVKEPSVSEETEGSLYSVPGYDL